VIFLLFGMMIIVSILKQTGLFESWGCGPLRAPAAGPSD
jgi:Na+/H+ antiporter NhaD/arsenite permease-like protein